MLKGELLKVIMVTPGYYPVKGGTETVVRNLSILLNKSGVHTDVMAFNMDKKWNSKWSGKIEKIDGITVFKIPALDWLPIVHSPRINLGVNVIPGRFAHLLKKYDIIHFHEIEFSFPLFSSHIKKPKILHLHGLDTNLLERYHIIRFILKHVADLYIAISKQMRKDLTDLGIPEEKIAYLPNGVDVNSFCPKKEKEDNMLLFVGRITYGKGLHVLLKALRYLKESTHLVIIGPAGWDLPYYHNVFSTSIKKINQEGKHKITYLGALDQADIIEWYQKASIFVLPSFWEGFPVTVLEALSCETPVVATPVGGIPEIVQNHENGILVPPGNPLKLAEAVQYLLDNKDIRIKMGRHGRESITKNFSIDVIAKRLREIYQKVIGQ
jgi:glycosyltransferase involved in cell wall biosynthesis